MQPELWRRAAQRGAYCSCLLYTSPGKTENLHIRSLVGRYLEHGRIYSFFDGTHKMCIRDRVHIKHQYPHCWRCHHPIIFRATEQWFCSMAKFREDVYKAIDTVTWMPDWGHDRMTGMAVSYTPLAGDKSSPQELMALAEKILSGEVPPFCPHGRPCVLKLTRKELERCV